MIPLIPLTAFCLCFLFRFLWIFPSTFLMLLFPHRCLVVSYVPNFISFGECSFQESLLGIFWVLYCKIILVLENLRTVWRRIGKSNQLAEIYIYISSFVVTGDIFVAFIYYILTRRIGMMLSLLVSYSAGKDTEYLLLYIISYS